MRRRIIKIVPLIIIAVFTISGIIAYLTDNERHYNKTNTSEVVVDIVETYNPPDPDDFVPGNTIQYQKTVSAKNTGKTDCYIRIAAEFSDSRVANESMLSSDNTNWYTVAEYKNHLPANWVYVNDATLGGAYYYYTLPVAVNAQTATPLFSHVKTTFDANEEAYPYDIYIYAEAVQTTSNTGEVLTGANAAVNTWRSFMGTGTGT